MTDPLFSLIKTAGITLLVTILWALSLVVAYWDIQRRKQAGERINPPVWMSLVAFLPFVGLAVYWIARLFSRTPGQNGLVITQPGGRRETKIKGLPESGRKQVAEMESASAVRKSPGTILGSDFSIETVRSLDNSGRITVDHPAPVQYRLSVANGPDQGKQFIIDRFPVQIGRDIDSAIRLEQDTGVSRKHALIYQINGALRIRDLKSRHGTRVNGKPVADQILEIGDQIEIGLSSLLFQVIES